MNVDFARALHDAKYMYVTTYSRAGKPGTVPTWLWPHDGAVHFTTRRASLKARRIRQNGRVTVRVGRQDGPAFEVSPPAGIPERRTVPDRRRRQLRPGHRRHFSRCLHAGV